MSGASAGVRGLRGRVKHIFGALAYVLFGLLLGIGLTAIGQPKRLTFDAGYSDCRYTPSPDGQWWQRDQEHSNHYKAGCGTFGISWAANDNWTAGIHYVSLGRAETHALAVAFPSDNRANMTPDIDPLRAQCAPAFSEGCKYQWHTGSFTRGVNLSLAYRLFNIGDVRIDGKGGLYIHRLSSSAVVEPLGCRDNCAWRIRMDKSAERIAPTWGFIVSWKYLYIGWERYERIGIHTPVVANVMGPVEVKTVGVRIPL